MFNYKKLLVSKLILLLIILPVWAMATSTHRVPRIIEGHDVTPVDKWPSMVSIHYSPDESSLCGGSLIYPYWVLTAAHCVDGFQLTDPPLSPEDLFVVVGLHTQSLLNQEGERHQIKQIIQHPRWNRLHPSWPFDIALLQLTQPSEQPPLMVPLKTPNLIADQAIIALGWGLTDSNDDNSFASVLQEVEFPLVSNKTCQTAYLGEREISQNMLCVGFAAGGKDTCLGDSGGPLIVFTEGRWQQVGIISYGGKRDGPRCGGSNAYTVATRVFEQLDFLTQYVPLPIEGVYDGIWTAPELPNYFVVVRNTVDTLALVFLNTLDQRWHTLLGIPGHLSTTVSSLFSANNMIAEFKLKVTPSPPINRATLTVIACQSTSDVAHDACFLPVRTTLSLKKLF